MKTQFYLSIFFLLLISCQTELLKLGTKISNKFVKDHKILIPSGAFVDCFNYKLDTVDYKVGVNSNNEIIYISTNDKGFSINDSISIKSTLFQLKDKSNFDINEVSGWGYYIYISDGWYAGFNFEEYPNLNAKANWFFKYEFNKKTDFKTLFE